MFLTINKTTIFRIKLIQNVHGSTTTIDVDSTTLDSTLSLLYTVDTDVERIIKHKVR